MSNGFENNEQDNPTPAAIPAADLQEEDQRYCAELLLPQHLQELRGSGLNEATIRAAGVYSEDDAETLAELLNWSRPSSMMAPAIVFPYTRLDGSHGYSRVKPDRPRTSKGKTVKYESPRGRANEVYWPAPCRSHIPDVSVPLLLAEGEKKALALAQAGHTCVGLVGVFGWKTARGERLLPELDQLSWQGRDVYIVFDSDVRHNDNVQNAENRLVAILRQKGAHVRVVRLPDGPADAAGNPRKLGADDFLVEHGEPAFQELLDNALEPAEPLQRRQASTLDPRVEIAALLAHRQDAPIVYLSGRWYAYQGGHYAELTENDVRTLLINRLNESTTHLTTSVVSNHVMQLMAQAALPADVTPPAWLGDAPQNWSAHEMLACPDQLIHLPSLVANQAAEMPATPMFFTPVALPVNVDLTAGPPTRWLNFLASLFPNDPECIALLQEWFGYCLTLDTRQQKILMIIGPTRSGKSTIARVLENLIGRNNVTAPTLAGLGRQFGLWPLLGKSVAIIADARLSGRSDPAVVIEHLLRISGEDTLSIDRKNLSVVEAKLNTRFVLISNELPRFVDTSRAVANRMMILPLTRSFLGQEDTRLLDHLLAELPGILLWAIQGWQRLQERGYFLEPASSSAAREEFEDVTSPLGAFIRECCERGAAFEVERDVLYRGYVEYCNQGNEYRQLPRNRFGHELRTVLPSLGSRQMHSGQRLYTGICLRSATGTQQVCNR